MRSTWKKSFADLSKNDELSDNERLGLLQGHFHIDFALVKDESQRVVRKYLCVDALTHSSRFAAMSVLRDEGMLVYLPWVSQVELISLMREIYLVMTLADSNPDLQQEQKLALIGMRIYSELEAFAQPEYLLSRLVGESVSTDEVHNARQASKLIINILSSYAPERYAEFMASYGRGIRFIPFREPFIPALKHWSNVALEQKLTPSQINESLISIYTDQQFALTNSMRAGLEP
ncbi:hypothetical protein [Pokkaliibacter plantistimulans]|nr:hypothetical protein [Pokkaliibacter plantistimulans]